MKQSYGQDWMPNLKNLEIIYIPIQESDGHWYLAVISFKARVIYHVDTQLDFKCTEDKQKTIGLACEVLTQMVATLLELDQQIKTNTVGLCEWQIEYARGIPNLRSSLNSAVWIMKWISKEQRFKPILSGDVVQMDVATRLIIGDHNKCLPHIQEEAHSFWKKLT
ncbi:uncharacterized protein LOC130749773 [Lotus japonicus]|uniref:uncharacterized protein LOC130749773 n=1 Tax=Lotus japonicus TaxID=34305 RepID=UPI00258524BD|nr:uncharacterized protein LOC130749773 [Lotus japonicus]